MPRWGCDVLIFRGWALTQKIVSGQSDRACWVKWCTPAGKKTSIDSLSYGNRHLELYLDRYNQNWILEMRNGYEKWIVMIT